MFHNKNNLNPYKLYGGEELCPDFYFQFNIGSAPKNQNNVPAKTSASRNKSRAGTPQIPEDRTRPETPTSRVRNIDSPFERQVDSRPSTPLVPDDKSRPATPKVLDENTDSPRVADKRTTTPLSPLSDVPTYDSCESLSGQFNDGPPTPSSRSSTSDSGSSTPNSRPSTPSNRIPTPHSNIPSGSSTPIRDHLDSSIIPEFTLSDAKHTKGVKRRAYISAEEVVFNKDNRLILPFSVRSTDFTQRKNVEAYVDWAVDKFQDTTAWMTGPLQIPSILLQGIQKRVLTQFAQEGGEKLLGEKEEKLDVLFKELRAKEMPAAIAEAKRLEDNAVNNLQSVLYKRHKKTVKRIRSNGTKTGKTPPNPSQLPKKEKNKTKGNPVSQEDKDGLPETNLEAYHTPPDRKADNHGGYPTLFVRQCTQSVPEKVMVSDEYKKFVEKIKLERKLFQILDCEFVTDTYLKGRYLSEELCTEAKSLYNMAMEDHDVKTEFNNMLNELSKTRLRSEYETLFKSDFTMMMTVFQKLFPHQQIINEQNRQALLASENRDEIVDYLTTHPNNKLNGLPREQLDALYGTDLHYVLINKVRQCQDDDRENEKEFAESNNITAIIDFLMKHDHLNIFGLTRDYTEEFLLGELPQFISSALEAMKRPGNGITYLGYPITKSLGKCLFDFTNTMLDKALLSKYPEYYKRSVLVDTSPVMPKAEYSQQPMAHVVLGKSANTLFAGATALTATATKTESALSMMRNN